jgi:hypothetical protein
MVLAVFAKGLWILPLTDLEGTTDIGACAKGHWRVGIKLVSALSSQLGMVPFGSLANHLSREKQSHKIWADQYIPLVVEVHLVC